MGGISTGVTFTLCVLALAQGTMGCGESDVVLDRIVGGVHAVKHSIPWQAGLTKADCNEVRCGGTIIDDTHILTAAHCTKGMKPSDIDVLAGEHDVTVAQGETRHKVARIIDHPRYNRSTLDYDFSILELYCDDKIDLTDKARAACLPSGKDSPRYESAATFNVSGWGHLADPFGPDAESPPEILHVVHVSPVPDSVCKKQHTGEITKQMICAGHAGSGVDACQGDSGGPLTWYDTQSGKWKLVGVVSFGIGCGGPSHSGVYAEVETVLDWVKKNSGTSCVDPATRPPTLCVDKWGWCQKFWFGLTQRNKVRFCNRGTKCTDGPMANCRKTCGHC